MSVSLVRVSKPFRWFEFAKPCLLSAYRVRSVSINEVRLERGRRGMVATVGQLCRAMGRHNFSADSRVSAGGDNFGNRARIRAVDALSEDYCEELWAVDPSSECIEACRRRFAAEPHVQCCLNDSRSLPMVPDGSIDFVFSFDSFVHFNRDVVEAYLQELRRKLKIGGKGFIHHSNFGEYVNSPRERLPEFLVKPLIKAKILDWAHHRNPSMTAELFRALCEQNGLQCLSRELVNWRGRRLIDCLSLFVRSDSAPENPTKIIRNPNFMREAARIRRQWQTQA
jgi:SAM-dependent methyltransferase